MIDRRLFGVAMALVFASSAAFGMQEIPKASAKALGVTRGKPFSSGVVFIEGKYLPPPYVVERWGNGIRINSTPVTGQIVNWNEFLKTQKGVKVVKTETVTAAPPPAAASPAPSSDDDDTSLDDLFDDEPKPKKAKKAAKKPAGPRKVTTTKVEFDGEFEMNAASQKMVARINSRRTVIDQKLRAGGFVFFGSDYAGTSGDAATAKKIIAVLPEAMQTATSEAQLSSICRSHGLSFLSAPIIADLFENRDGYVRLVERRRKMAEEAKWNNMLNGGN